LRDVLGQLGVTTLERERADETRVHALTERDECGTALRCHSDPTRTASPNGSLAKQSFTAPARSALGE
jgi:hypothetical protein